MWDTQEAMTCSPLDRIAHAKREINQAFADFLIAREEAKDGSTLMQIFKEAERIVAMFDHLSSSALKKAETL